MKWVDVSILRQDSLFETIQTKAQLFTCFQTKNTKDGTIQGQSFISM